MLHPIQPHQVSAVYKRSPSLLWFTFDASPRRMSGGSSRGALGGDDCCSPRRSWGGDSRGARGCCSPRRACSGSARGARGDNGSPRQRQRKFPRHVAVAVPKGCARLRHPLRKEWRRRPREARASAAARGMHDSGTSPIYAQHRRPPTSNYSLSSKESDVVATVWIVRWRPPPIQWIWGILFWRPHLIHMLCIPWYFYADHWNFYTFHLRILWWWICCLSCGFGIFTWITFMLYLPLFYAQAWLFLTTYLTLALF
jgi:hypothetical protein